jgi:hypothetical protein
MQFVLAGCYYRAVDARRFVSSLTEPVPCQFVADPTNAADPSAIKVMCKGLHIGFVPRNKTAGVQNYSHGIIKPISGDHLKYQPLIEVSDGCDVDYFRKLSSALRPVSGRDSRYDEIYGFVDSARQELENQGVK